MVPMLKNAELVIALVTLSRNIASGMSGSRAVSSLPANNIHSMAEVAIKLMIGHEVQR